MRMLSSWVLILFVASKPKRRSVARKLVPLVAGAFWPLALPIGEEAPARAWWSVQLPQQYRVAVRHEPVLLLQLAVAVVVVACVVEPRHVQAAVGKSLMESRQVGSFISYLGSAGRANFVQSLGGLFPDLNEWSARYRARAGQWKPFDPLSSLTPVAYSGCSSPRGPK